MLAALAVVAVLGTSSSTKLVVFETMLKDFCGTDAGASPSGSASAASPEVSVAIDVNLDAVTTSATYARPGIPTRSSCTTA